MNMNKDAMDRNRSPGIRAVLLSAALVLSGCATTVHNRWANEHDTLHRWQLKMRTMPVEIHGGFTNQNAEAIAAMVTRGTTPELYNSQHKDPDAALARIPRVLIYIGTSYLPADASYCQPRPVLRVSDSQADKVNVFGAICDGGRLVVRAEDKVPAVALNHSGEEAIVKTMKERLLYAVSTNPAIPSAGT